MSWFEVETKVKIPDSDIKGIRARIRKVARFMRKSHKEDIYYTFKSVRGYPEERFRIRKANNKYKLNFKRRGKHPESDRIAVKEEFEFPVSNLKMFSTFLQEFDFKPFVHKIKDSEVYKYDGVHIEINKVKHLGWFLELEVLSKSEKGVSVAKQKIEKVLKLLEIKAKQIDNTGYTKMLYKKRAFK